MTAKTLVIVSGVSLHDAMLGQELLADYHFSSWMCLGQVSAQAVACHAADENGPKRTIDDLPCRPR